jgi:hypothetical protein
MWEPRRLTTLWSFTACYRDRFTFTFYLYVVNTRAHSGPSSGLSAWGYRKLPHPRQYSYSETLSFRLKVFVHVFLHVTSSMRSRYSDWLRAGRPTGRNSSPGGSKNFLFSSSCRPALGSTQPPIRAMDTGGSFPRVKRLEHEADHSPPVSAEVKKIWIYTSTPPYAFLA